MSHQLGIMFPSTAVVYASVVSAVSVLPDACYITETSRESKCYGFFTEDKNLFPFWL